MGKKKRVLLLCLAFLLALVLGLLWLIREDTRDTGSSMAEEAGLGEYFMGHNQQAGFVGHGVGIELNEAPVLAPRSKEIIKKGMVLALEPKFVIPGVGVMGIENTVAVTEYGIDTLTVCDENIVQLKK